MKECTGCTQADNGQKTNVAIGEMTYYYNSVTVECILVRRYYRGDEEHTYGII